MSSKTRPAFTSLSRRQRALLVVVLLAIPVLLFALLEVGLRIGGYGSDYPLFVPFDEAPGYLVANRDVARRYFRHESGIPTPVGDLFLAGKPADGYRIFVQGASTTAGFPYYHGGAFSRMLEQRLQATFPDRTIEVVNVALDATNSHTLLDLAPEILEQQPDAILIYAGHNEYYGVLGVASAESVSRSTSVVRAYLALRQLRTTQLLESAIDRIAGMALRVTGRTPTSTRTLMEYLASEHTVTWGSPLYQAGSRQLERNFDDLLALYADAGVPVFIGTLVSNERDLAPFVSEPAADVDTTVWRRAVEETVEALDAGAGEQALQNATELLALDSTAAYAWYLQGRALAQSGQHDAARDAFIAARDRDQLPFRAPSVMNTVIRDVARRHGATVVDVLDAFVTRSSEDGIGNELILEHLHPNIDGQFLIADAFYEALRAAGAIGDWTGGVARDEARSRAPVTAIDSIAGELRVRRLTSRYPFVPAGTPREETQRPPEDEISRIARAYEEDGLPWVRAQGQLQELYARRGRWVDAAHVNRVVAQEMSHAPEPLQYAAELELRAGRLDRARQDVIAAQARMPTSRGALMLGRISFVQGDTAAARGHFREAVARAPTDRTVVLTLHALDDLSRLRAAAMGDSPAGGSADAHAALGTAYYLLGAYDDARTQAEQALRLSPDHRNARALLGQMGVRGSP